MKKIAASMLLAAVFAIGGVTTATAADASIGFQSPTVDRILKMGNWPH
ncbi:hypothetical protein IWX64_000806 [Arthrobacter sp. CAN_A212]|nr:hypothetical protein [Arthrobacter sp. CAN_C5]